MKVKKIMLVTLILLAILTIGAVSATEELAVNETQNPVGLSVDDESIIAEDENLGDDKNILAEDEGLGDDDSNEKVDLNLSSDVIPKNYVINMDGDYDLEGVNFYIGSGFSGRVILKMNDTEIYNRYCDDEAYEIYLSRLDYGTYNWELSIVDDSGQYNPLTLTGTTNIIPVDIKIPEHVSIGGYDSIIIYYSLHVGGTITVLIDGKKYFEGPLYDEDDCSIKRIDLDNISFENHTCEVIYSGYRDFKPLTANQTFDVDYYLDYYIFERDILYGENVALEINHPKDAKGNITVTINGKKYTAKADELDELEYPGCNVININNLKPGENKFTITYEGDDKYYYPKTINGTIYTNTNILYSYSMAFTDSITLRLPEDAKGNLVVKVDDEIYANATAKNGIFNVSLKDLALRNYYIEASYDGDDYDVDSISDNINIIPKFTYPERVGYLEDVLITVEVPKGVEGIFKIYERDPNNSWDDDAITEINSTEIVDGKASIILNKFHKTSFYDAEEYNRFILEIENDTYQNRQNYNPSVRNHPRDSDFNIILPETVPKSTPFKIIIEDNVARSYDIYVDGVYLKGIYNQKDEEDYDDPSPIVLDNIEYGKHKIEFRYVDEYGYYKSINKTYYINVSYITINIPEEIISEGEVKTEFEESVTGTLTLYLNGEEFASKFINGSKMEEYSFYIDDLAFGKYDCEVVYSGDANHAKVSKKSTIDFTYPMEIMNLDKESDAISGQDLDLTVSLPSDVNGTVSITVNGKKYSAKARDYTNFKIDNIKHGSNEIVLSYEGDNKYPAKTMTYHITGHSSIILEDNTLILDMPVDATGNMVVTIDYTTYSTVPVTNGKAALKLNELDVGSYYITAKYDGKDYEVYEFNERYYSFNITQPKYVWIEEGCLISVELPKDCNGQLIIEHNVYEETEWGYMDYVYKEVNRTDIINGTGSVRLTTFDKVSDMDDDWENNRYRIIINYGEDKSLSLDYSPIVMGKDPNFQLTLDTQANILKNDKLTVETNLDDDLGYVEVYIDGAYYKRFFSKMFDIDASEFDYGNHYIEVKWPGNEYYPSKTAETSFNITYILVDVAENATVGEYNAISGSSMTISSEDNVGGYVTVYIDNEIVLTKFIKSENIYVDLSSLSPGKHLYEVIYSGDENYHSTISAGEFNAVYSGIAYAENQYIDEGKDAEITVEMLKDATGKIEITVADKKYTKDVINGTATFIVSGLSVGEYEITAKYLGDDKYPAYTIDSTEVSVMAIERDYYRIQIGETSLKYGENTTVTLKLPSDAIGQLYVYIDDLIYKKTDLINGYAEIVISNLKYGEYNVIAQYETKNYVYDVSDADATIYVEPVTGDYNIINRFNDTVIIPLELANDINGDLKAYIGKKLITTQKIVNGKVNVDLTGKLDLGNNMINLKFDNDKYNIDYEVNIIILPNIIAPKNMTIGEDKQVQFIFGDEYNGNLTAYYGLVKGHESDEKIVKTKVVNGKASISLSEMSHGLNMIGFTYEDATHEFSSYGFYYDMEQIYVNVMNKQSAVTVFNTTQSTKIKLDEDATGSLIVKINGSYYTAELENGEVVIDAVGDEIIISYSGDAKYEGFEDMAVNSSGAEIELIDAEITVNADDINVGDVLVINIQANENLTADVNVTVNNKTYTVNVINGKGNMSIDDLTAGSYDVNVTFAGNDLFKKAENSTAFNVNKLTPTIIINAAESIVEQSDLSVEITIEGATGNVTVNDVEIALKDGTATTSISNLTLGENIITVVYNGDEKYLNATKSIKVDVFAKADPELTVTVSNINVGEDAVVNIEINRNATGKVTVDGNEISIAEGKGTYTITKPSEGNHTITVKYEGDKYFTQDEKTIQYTVAKKEFPPEEDPFAPQDENETESETPTYTINLPSDATGTLEVTIANKTYTKELTNGSASITIDNLPAGDYNATIKYSGDEKYAPITKTVNTSVKAKDPELKVSIENIIVGEDATLNIEINTNATGKVTVDGTEVNIKDGKGTYTITKPSEGNHTITVKYEGDKYFTQDEKTIQYTVAKKEFPPEEDPFAPSSADENKTSENNPTFTINLPSDATGTLEVTIGNKTYTKELTNGSASITVDDLPAGDYTATLKYSGDAKYAPIVKTVNGTVKVNPVIVAKATSVQYNAGKYFQVTVYGTDGKLAANTKVTFTVAGKTFKTVNTNAKGIAKFKVTQIPKTYTVVAKALGTSAKAKLTVKHIVTLKSITVKKSAKKLVLQAKLAKVNGKYLAKKTVTFKFNGKTYKVKTDKKGVAKLTIKNTVLKKLKVGKKITYQATYLKDTVKKTVKVKK